jgi:hypothetical protein
MGMVYLRHCHVYEHGLFEQIVLKYLKLLQNQMILKVFGGYGCTALYIKVTDYLLSLDMGSL